ncbi:CPBP family intramembrane metalloprotease [Paenibacillus dendritiformis]|uniref:CPBP family intramembrane glutamic endopeptidase n=1 Tax=Paenibacillus dendritiformis TaxID=130049 RepID=UPI0010594054|nr:type II CAAX endopeptidase family protein [Paenibacillus dendritiformis]TDL47699.1 CPBP family intramembrane metalloprotease [Paenibacillus dendritiformis]
MSNNLIPPPRTNEQVKVPWNGIDVLFIIVIWRLLLSAPVMNAAAVPLEYLGLLPAYARYTAAFLIHIIQLAVIGLVIIRKYQLTWTSFGFHRPTRKDWLQLLPWALLANLISLLVLWVTFTFLWSEGSSKAESAESVGFILTLLMGAVVAPFVEEVVNRGVIYGYLRSRFGVLAGVIVSALIFGVGHAPELMLNAIVTGSLFALFYERRGTLWMPVMLHGVMNATLIFIFWLSLFLR